MVYSFISFKLKERTRKHVRYSFTLKDILSMSMPALINAAADTIFFFLIYTLNDELIVQAFSSLEIVVIGIASYLILGRKYLFFYVFKLDCRESTGLQSSCCVHQFSLFNLTRVYIVSLGIFLFYHLSLPFFVLVLKVFTEL